MIRGHDGAQLKIPAALNPRVGMSIETDDVLWYWNPNTERYEQIGAGEMEKRTPDRVGATITALVVFGCICVVSVALTIKVVMWVF